MLFTHRPGAWFCVLLAGLAEVPATAVIRHDPDVVPDPDPGRALIVMTYPYDAHDGIKSPTFLFVNDSLVGTLTDDCYAYAMVQPGQALLWPDTLHDPLLKVLEAGGVYYARVNAQEILTFRSSTIDDVTGLAALMEHLCEATTKERRKAEKMIEDRYRAAVVLGGKTCPLCKGRKIAEKVLEEWPRVDLTPYPVLRIDFSITDPAAEQKEFVSREAERSRDRFPSLIFEALDRNLFEEIQIGSEGNASGSVILRIEFPRYEKDLFNPYIGYISFKASLVDATDHRHLVELSGQPIFWTTAPGAISSALLFERTIAVALAAYLELSKCGDGSGALAPPARPTPFACKALELAN